MMKRMLIQRAAAATLMTMTLLTLGCADQGATPLAGAEADFAGGRYAQAYDSAAGVSRTPTYSDNTRTRASYIAGASAYRLRNEEAAQQHLEYATTSKDPAISADARVQLGLLFTEQNKFRLAAEHFLTAAESLSGPERANAYYYGGIAQQKDGRWASARTSLSMAQSLSTDPAFRNRVREQLRVTGFALQVAAYNTEEPARGLVNGLTPKAKQERMVLPKIVPTVDPASKQTVYTVQVGQFSSWPTAMMARDTLGVSKAAIVPLMQDEPAATR